ncbi:MAG: hypothetical protein K1X42_07780 [Opitutaceae bacterium]|nr:hypothetical protein [Opitutaceae bacterium]
MKLLLLAVICYTTSIIPGLHAAAPKQPIVGMYVHTHWPYNHPYAARTWTLEDWQGYLKGIKEMGYNTVLFWPLVETMPQALTPSDQAHIQKIARVIDFAHEELGLRFYLTLCPNIVADDAVAIQADFERRHFFHSDLRVDPNDATAVATMIERRARVLQPLARADGIVIIDSDPGGFPGATNEAFVNLLMAHRRMFDTLRPGIELVYWMHAGWPAYSRYYETGNFKRGTKDEFTEVLSLLKKKNPKPWSLANNLEAATALGLEDRVVNFRYGQIEQEPQFPFTNFWPKKAWQAGADSAPRGVVGNAQSHVLQLPNTFAFAKGARKEVVQPADFRNFAERLIHGHGETIFHAWETLASNDPVNMRNVAEKLAAINPASLTGGDLQGLIFRDPAGYVTDLGMQLQVAAAYTDLLNAEKKHRSLLDPLADFLSAVRPWQERTGYQNQWKWSDLKRILAILDIPEINVVLTPRYLSETPFGKIKEGYYQKEKQTSLLIEAMAAAVERLKADKQRPRQ